MSAIIAPLLLGALLRMPVGLMAVDPRRPTDEGTL